MKDALSAALANSPNIRTPSSSAFFPTNGSSPARINQANQGIPTGADNSTIADAPVTAGTQVKSITNYR
jgi:hypothetical protein